MMKKTSTMTTSITTASASNIMRVSREEPAPPNAGNISYWDIKCRICLDEHNPLFELSCACKN